MSGRKPTKNNQPRPAAPANSDNANAQQQGFKDSERDPNDRNMNREQVRSQTTNAIGQTK